MSPTSSTYTGTCHRLADLAAVAAHLGGSSFTSRTHPRFVGGYLASSRRQIT